MREAYRLHKHCLAACSGVYFLIAYIYMGAGKPCAFKTIQEKIVASLQYLNHLHTQHNYDPLQA